tara:strand:+ start:99 stop:1187 length:1089 start_codon:yes stop_codon:yes gene_type:complete
MGFEVPFNTTNECYSSDNIINNNIIKLQNGEDEELETMKYSKYINNPKYFDKTPYSFKTSATDSNEAYKKCKERTEELNSDFFLVSDVSYSQQKFHYNCYIPKNSQRCNTNTLQKLISPFEQVFNKMFGVDPDIFQGTSDISSIIRGVPKYDNFVLTKDDYATMDACSNNCFRINNEVLLPKTKFFGIFYSKYLDINSNDANVDSYVSQTIKTDISYIEENYTEDNLNGILTQLHSSLQNNICTNQDLPNIDAIDESIKRLDEFYNGGGDDPKYIGFINSLEQLGNDISNIGQSSKTNTKYLRAVDDLVKKSNSKLNNVLKLDGANNGKYNDTQYLKNQKISEIIVLMLIIIFLIFIYSKKK